jgi:S-adenosylmethionine hydrolase
MIITLTTDFGSRDGFAGIMKGVILGIAPEVQIVDLTHDLGSFDIGEAAWVVNSAYRYFPEGTIHVVVVDPGVGSTRHPIAAFAHGQYFVGPDNGVFSFVLHTDPTADIPPVHRISNPGMFRAPVSRTFHGRDIFAPTAAYLARGTPLESVGERVPDFITRSLPKPRPRGDQGLLAHVVRIDKFGNIQTSLRRHDLGSEFTIFIAGLAISRLRGSFSEADPGEFFAIEGSTGFIEIALNQGSASARLNVVRDSEIEVETGPPNH